MIPSPNLDDRTHRDIVEEAIRLIPHYCPEWTNHNPTDPGITLIELFAWMVEMLIYRLNRVPDKTYLTLLDLIGLSLVSPQASRVLLNFTSVEKYEGEIFIKRGMQVSTAGGGSGSSIIFETEKDCVVSNIVLEECISTDRGLVTHNMSDLKTRGDGFLLFSGGNEIERYIYISDPSFEFLSESNYINLVFKNRNEIKSSTLEIINYLEWEYWNGKKWLPLDYRKTIPGRKRADNEIFFKGPIEIEKVPINGTEEFFLRASLVSIPEKEECFEMVSVSSNLLFYGHGLNPDLCICNTDNMVFNELDISKDFSPFLETPKYNDVFYICSEEVFSKEGAEISIDIRLSDAEGAQPEPDSGLILKYEYWDGSKWSELARTTVKGVQKPLGKYSFTDTTCAFTMSGKITFTRPANLQRLDVNNQNGFWIRIRIGAGDFGKGGRYITDEQGKWVWLYDKPVKPPVMSHIGLRYTAPMAPVKTVVSYYDFTFYDLSSENIQNYSDMEAPDADMEKLPSFRILEINREKNPITYFGFNRAFPERNSGIYFRVKERKKTLNRRPEPLSDNGNWNEGLARSVSLRWEYWNGEEWSFLSANDYTDNFHESGFVEFNRPSDFSSKSEFGRELFWLRLIHEYGSFEISPRITDVHLNSVFALNRQTYYNEMLGSSSGTPGEEFSFIHGPLLPGIEIMVKETTLPPVEEREMIIAEEGSDAIQVLKGSDGSEEVWIRYHQVPNFYSSNSKSRHYCLDYTGNRVIFGNGTRGIIPPRLKNSIKAGRYYTGGGTIGNVGRGTVSIIRENIPYIAEVINHYPAEGGADIESLDDLKSRATGIFKNLNRAVTSEDYEWLAREASSSVARARCLSKTGSDGEVIVVILPHPDTREFNLKQDLYPTSELLRRVREFLNARKLVGTKLKVEPPLYRGVDINLKLVLKKGISELQIVLDQIELTLRRFLHPITGGPSGEGWGFGVPLAKSDIFGVLETIDSIYFVEEIEIVDTGTGLATDKLVIEEDSLISVSRINIQERKNQY